MISKSYMQRGKLGLFGTLERSANLISAHLFVYLEVLLCGLSVLLYFKVRELGATSVFMVFSVVLLVISIAVLMYVKKREGVFFKWNLMYLVIAFILMILYEGFWIRYFRSPHTMKDMYASFAGVPLAGAVLPVLALLLMGVYSRNWIVILSSIILGIGHIGIHYMHWKELNT